MIWNAVERFGTAFFLFISNIVLARLLSPDDFGCIGMLLVFINISDAIVDGGFDSALIQKRALPQRIILRFFIGILFFLFFCISCFFSCPANIFLL